MFSTDIAICIAMEDEIPLVKCTMAQTASVTGNVQTEEAVKIVLCSVQTNSVKGAVQPC